MRCEVGKCLGEHEDETGTRTGVRSCYIQTLGTVDVTIHRSRYTYSINLISPSKGIRMAILGDFVLPERSHNTIHPPSTSGMNHP
jgi:hypothetical protein